MCKKHSSQQCRQGKGYRDFPVYDITGWVLILYNLLLSVFHTKGVIVIVTIGDLIKQGIIRQYIPPHKGGNSEGVKEEKPVALQDSSEVMQEVFQAWIMSDVAGKRRKRKALKDM